MRSLVVALALLAGCAQHPYRSLAVGSAVVTGAAATCAFVCDGAARETADVTLVVEAVAVAAAVSLLTVFIVALNEGSR